VDQVQSALSSKKGIEEAEVKQWDEMTALAQLLLNFVSHIFAWSYSHHVHRQWVTGLQVVGTCRPHDHFL